MEAHATQDGEFGQMENAIGIGEKDDDFIAIFLLETQAPASRTLSTQECNTQAGKRLRLRGGRDSRLLRLPQAESSTERHDQQGKVTMHDHRRLVFLGKPSQVPGMLALLENAILDH